MNNVDAWDLIAGDDPRKDGKMIVIMGGYGAGKTVLLQRIARAKLAMGDVVIIRSKRKDTWQVFANTKNVNIIAQKGTGEITFDAQLTTGNKDPKLNALEVNYCGGPDQAIKMLKKDAINIIVTSNMRHVSEAAWWTLFFHFLASTKRKQFTSIFMDELHELFPEGLESDVFHFVPPFIEAIDNFRKSMVNFYFSTHDKDKLFYKIFNTAEYRIFMSGAKILKRGSRINSQPLIDNLGIGEGILEYRTGFVGFSNVIDEDSLDDLLPTFNIMVNGEQVFDYYLRPDYLRILDLDPWYTEDCAACGYHWTTKRNQAPRCPRCGATELEVRLGKFSDNLFNLVDIAKNTKAKKHTPPRPHN
jgi:KaiC/GvpD/RAD55 family RecA-like ATPase